MKKADRFLIKMKKAALGKSPGAAIKIPLFKAWECATENSGEKRWNPDYKNPPFQGIGMCRETADRKK
jgi:hypothetical protein